MTIPQELSDAARVEGADEFQILWRVIIPLAKPAIAAIALFQFLYAWNDFFDPLIYSGNIQPDRHSRCALRSCRTQSRSTTACSGTSRWRHRCCSCCP